MYPSKHAIKIIQKDSVTEIAEEACKYITGGTIAVSGGRTFSTLFSLWKKRVTSLLETGKKIEFFPVDERQVPFDDPSCNWRIAYEQLLEPVGLSNQKKRHTLSLNAFIVELNEILALSEGRFDTVFLGMGDDGHTASLFPKGDYLTDAKSMALATLSPKNPKERLTLALRPIWEAEVLVTIATGADKAPMVKRLLEGDESLPITLALAGHRSPILILDKDAAKEL
jgi:6-phosphogluconolactonase